MKKKSFYSKIWSLCEFVLFFVLYGKNKVKIRNEIIYGYKQKRLPLLKGNWNIIEKIKKD